MRSELRFSTFLAEDAQDGSEKPAKRRRAGARLARALEAVMNLLRNGLLMRKTGDRGRTELTEESASQSGFSAEFVTRSRPVTYHAWFLYKKNSRASGLTENTYAPPYL